VSELVQLVKKEIFRTGLWVGIAVAFAAAAAYLWK
jgi:hypothetical protein